MIGTHERLVALLDEHGATYRIVEHEGIGACGLLSGGV